jgi:restriction endonuclease S subunit
MSINDIYFQSVKRCHIFPGDLLFSIMASLGATAIVPENYSICTANRAVGILRPKPNAKLLPQFVQALFNTNLGISLLELEKRGGIQQRVNLSDLSQLKLPAPSVVITL